MSAYYLAGGMLECCPHGWPAAAAGTGVGAVVGVLVGLGIAWLRSAQPSDLDRVAPSPTPGDGAGLV